MQALKEAGYDGLDTSQLVEAVHASGVKTWEDQRIAKSSVASSCTHDPAFVRLQKGRFALRALRPDLEVRPCLSQSKSACLRLLNDVSPATISTATAGAVAIRHSLLHFPE